MKMERCRDTVVGRLFNAFLEEIGGEIRTSPAMIIQLEGTNNSTIAYKQEYSRRTSSMDLLAYHDWSVYIALQWKKQVQVHGWLPISVEGVSLCYQLR